MKLDREYQRQLLQQIADAYPHPAEFHVESIENTELSEQAEQERKTIANLLYLEGHGLVENHTIPHGDGTIHIQRSELTSKGADFLAQDGGLSAVLGVQTVRLHADTLRELLALSAGNSNLPEHEKSAFKQAVEGASDEAVRTVTQQLLAAAFASAPGALQLIRTALIG